MFSVDREKKICSSKGKILLIYFSHVYMFLIKTCTSVAFTDENIYIIIKYIVFYGWMFFQKYYSLHYLYLKTISLYTFVYFINNSKENKIPDTNAFDKYINTNMPILLYFAFHQYVTHTLGIGIFYLSYFQSMKLYIFLYQ